MTYEVAEIGSLPESPPALVVRSTQYTSTESTDIVSTEISLWEVDRNVGGSYLSYSFLASALNGKEDYNILIQQKDLRIGVSKTFFLHSSPDKEVSRAAYRSICSTLEPLVDAGTLLLTKKLVETLIVPVPIPQSKLVQHISEFMLLKPDAHPDCVSVLQALVHVAFKVHQMEEQEGQIKRIIHIAKKLCLGEERKDIANTIGKPSAHQASSCIDAAAKEKEEFYHSCDSKHATPEEKGIIKIPSFHDADNRKFLNALNAPNRKGYTPLMLSVLKNRITIAVTFLQAGSLPDIPNPKTGDTALHYAVELGLAPIVKALIVFGAQVEIRNEAGFTPLDLAGQSKAEGAKECGEILKEVIDLMHEAASNVSDKLEPVNIPQNSIFLLSMDGGGTRGLLLVQSLMAIQKRMKRLSPECCAIHTYFDYIAGTSAGGLATLMCCGATLEVAMSSFFKIAADVFTKPPTIQPEVVQKCAKEVFGKDIAMTDILFPRIIVNTTLACYSPPVLHPICNYGDARNKQKPPSEWKVWEAAIATSAAPFYFLPFEGKYIDGAVVANNPTLDAMAEVYHQERNGHSERTLALVVSLGAGEFPLVENDNVSIDLPNQGNLSPVKDFIKSVEAAGNMFNVISKQLTLTGGQQVAKAEAWCGSLSVPYFRLSPQLNEMVKINEADKTVLIGAMFEQHLYLLRNARQVDAIAHTLLCPH